MEMKKYTQFGTFSVAIFLPLLLLLVVLLIKSALSNTADFYILALLALVFLGCLLLFYKLTITVDSMYVSFKLGIGWIGKSYKITDIKSCRPVSNAALNGIGIRMLHNGWLYNVSGLKAIELQFHHKKSVVRIGTDKPDEVSRHIQSLIGSGGISGEDIPRSANNPIAWVVGLSVALLIFAVALIPNYRETKVNFDGDGFTIKGMYGLTIPFSEIEQVDLVQDIPGIARRTNGYAFGKTRIGNFKLSDGNPAKLFVKKGVAPYVLIKSRGRVPVYLNYEDGQQTMDLYNKLKDKR